MSHPHSHPHPQPIVSILAGAPPNVSAFLDSYLQSLYSAVCEMGTTIREQQAQIAKLTKDRNDLTGIATVLSDDLAEAKATPQAADAAADAAASLIASFGTTHRLKATHRPTGKRCSIIREDGERVFCDFGESTNPLTWVKRDELTIDGSAA